MSLEYHSAKRRRVYQRLFDHDECRELYADGWTHKALSEKYGVSIARISQVCNPATEAAVRRSREEFVAAICDDCGGDCTHNWSSKHGRHDRVVCRSCDARRRSEDHLMDRLDADGDILCNDCGQHRPHDEYQLRRGVPAPYCRACVTARRRAYREAHPEVERAAYERQKARRRAARQAS